MVEVPPDGHHLTGRDWVALVLGIFVGCALLTVTIGTTSAVGEIITPTEGELLAAVLGAAIGAVATYLGGGQAKPPDKLGE